MQFSYLNNYSFLTIIIHFIGIASLSARIVGTRTKKVAFSTSLFNIIILISQFSNTIQAPLLAKSIEKNIVAGNPPNNSIFRLIIFSATIGSILGLLAIPTIHRFMKKGVDALYLHRSIFTVFIKSLRFSTITHFKESLTIPSIHNISNLKNYRDIPMGLIFLNVFVYSFITVSVLSCLYAGYLNPNLRSTALAMNGFSIGLGSIGMMLFVEPYNATLTDKVIDGTTTESYFRRCLTFVVIARIFGTILGQFLLVPMAWLIIRLSEWLYV